MSTPTTTTHPTSAPAAKPKSAGTGGTCPVEGCGNAATHDVAVNPGLFHAGGAWPEPYPDPPGVTLPKAPDPVPPGPWHLVTCADDRGVPVHRTLWPEGRLDELTASKGAKK